MALPRNEQGPQRLRSVPLFDNLHLENSFEDNVVAGQQVLDLLALEDVVFQRSLSAQPDPHNTSAVQQGQVRSAPARPRRYCRPAAPLPALRSATAGPDPQVVV